MNPGGALIRTRPARPPSAACESAAPSSQVGFWGAIWFGFGIVLWRASSHLQDEVDLFRLLCGTIVLSGLARLGAAIAYGLPGPVLTGAMVVELIEGTDFLLWHASALRHPNLNTAAQPYSA